MFSLHQHVTDPLAFSQRSQSCALHCSGMNEHVAPGGEYSMPALLPKANIQQHNGDSALCETQTKEFGDGHEFGGLLLPHA
jgi:hypothetical protein